MFRKSAFYTLALFIFTIPAIAADLTSQDIQNALTKNLSHPYLYFTEQEKPAILDRIRNNPECAAIMARLLAEANRLLFTPLEPQAPVQEKNSRYYTTGDYDRYYYSNRQNAFTLAFVYQMTGDGQYARKSFEFADALCDLPTWVIRAHEFPIIYSRVWPWNCKDDQTVFSFDILVGENARILATVYDWLYPALDKRQRDRIRGALLEKAITRVRGNYEYHWWAASYRCNWCSVCNSGLGLAALALMNEDPQLTDVVAESANRISKMLDEIGPDGGWQEGLSYWYYGTHPSAFFADPLKRLTDGKYNLFSHPRIKKNTVNFPVYCYIPTGRTGNLGRGVDFGDSGTGVTGRSFYYNKLAAETGSAEAAWYRNIAFKEGNDIFDILWPVSTVTPASPEQPSIHFRGIDWVIMRSDFTDPSKVIVAAKAGMNDDPHHGHLDVGHFIVYWNGEGFISESGHPAYDEKYFDEARYDCPQARSIGHNVVLVNGEEQLVAKHKDQPWKEGIGGKVLDFRTSAKRDYTLMDPTNAHPKVELKNWRRHITLEKPVITVVLDEVSSAPGAEIETRFHSQVTQTAKDGYVLLEGEKGNMALIPVIQGSFTFRSGRHAILAVQKNAEFHWSPYVGAVLKAASARTVMATIILPVKNDDEAAKIVRSVKKSFDSAGNYSLSFKKDGKTWNYLYRKGAGGLVLE